MAQYGRGLICAPIEEERAKELDLDMMVNTNTALHETAFTVSVDLIGQGCSTGISAYDRAMGIQALIDPKTTKSDFARPGHIFPLIAKKGGVLRRTGHTEAAIDLAKLAGHPPAGALVEILKEDGSMARFSELRKIADRHGLCMISIKDLVAYRLKEERLIEKVSSGACKSPLDGFTFHLYEQKNTEQLHHIAITYGDWDQSDEVLVRVHSSSDRKIMLGLLMSGYADRYNGLLQMIRDHGKGVFLLMRQESCNLDVPSLVDLFLSNATESDRNASAMDTQRDFGVGAQILNALGVKRIKLLTNHPKKRVGLEGYGLKIVDTAPFL
jgi:3,4-dihydroxy 2-butanone 4-phosphate synthase/GTP cyclohydrolase II